MVTANYKRVVEYWKTNRPVDLKTMDVTGKRSETDEWRIRIYEEDTLISEFGPSCEFDCWRLTVQQLWAAYPR